MFVTKRDVELLEVGENWETSTGVFSFTREDLESAIESLKDPAVREPIIKLGHVDARFDGQPAFGRVTNPRLSNNGMTLVADLEGLPKWLADAMPSAYPRRSIEGEFNHRTQTGNRWPFVLTALALLGEAYPAITTLEDIELLHGDEPPPLVPVHEIPEFAAASGPSCGSLSIIRAERSSDLAEWKRGGPVKAGMSVEDVRRSFYDRRTPDRRFWWVREVRLDPLELIVDDEDGHLLRVPVTMSGERDLKFGEPVQIEQTYASQTQKVAATYANPQAAGRPDEPNGATVNSHDPDPHTEEVGSVQLTDDAIRALGLEPGATQEEVNAAIIARNSEEPAVTTPPAHPTATPPGPARAPQTNVPNTPDPNTGDDAGEPTDQPQPPETEAPQGEPAPTAVAIPEGMQLIDSATLANLQAGVAAAQRIEASQKAKEVDDMLDRAIKAGKFPRSRRAHYVELFKVDPEGTKQVIASLAPGLIPVEPGQELGAPGNEDDVDDNQNGYPETWAPTVAAARRSLDRRVKVVSD